MLSQLSERSSCSKLINAFERELIQTSRLQGFKLNEFLQRINNHQTSDTDSDLLAPASTDLTEGGGGEGGALVFVNEWWSAIVDSVVAIYLTTILRVTSISNIGALQMLTDIDYLR